MAKRRAARRRFRPPVRRSQRSPGSSPGSNSGASSGSDSGTVSGTAEQGRWWTSKEAKVAYLSLVLGIPTAVIATLIVNAVGSGTANNGQGPAAASPTPTAAVAGDPLRVTQVRYVPRQNDHGWVMTTPLSETALRSLNHRVANAGGALSDDADPIMRAAGAVDPTASTIEVNLESNRPGRVLITDIRPVIVHCRKPLDGTLLYYPPQGVTDTVKIGFNLDTPSPIAQYTKDDPNDGPPIFHGDYFEDHKYALNQGDQVTFRLTARSFTSYCEYRYRINMIANGHPQPPQIVDDSGRPFKVSAEILSTPDRHGNIRCAAYQRVYIGQGLMPGFVDTLPPWNVPPRTGAAC